MGTFHDDRGGLHGITVAAFAADTVYVVGSVNTAKSGADFLDDAIHWH